MFDWHFCHPLVAMTMLPPFFDVGGTRKRIQILGGVLVGDI
jgi:hypothetical protein